MAQRAERPETETYPEIPNQVKGEAREMLNDVKGEVKHEIHRIHTAKEPVDPSQSDHVVRKHVNGLSITFFLLIGLFLVVAIAGIAIGGSTIFGHH